MTDDPAADITPDALQAIGELLNLAARHGIGVILTPDDDGWDIGYMVGMGGGSLSSAFDLATAVEAAKRPLLDVAATLRRQ